MQRDVFGFIFGTVFLLVGAGLLCGGVSARDSLQLQTISGAALVSLGGVTLGSVLRDRLKWKRELKKCREESRVPGWRK